MGPIACAAASGDVPMFLGICSLRGLGFRAEGLGFRV